MKKTQNLTTWFNRKTTRIKELEKEVEKLKKSNVELRNKVIDIRYERDKYKLDVESPAKFKVGNTYDGIMILDTFPESDTSLMVRKGFKILAGMVKLILTGGCINKEADKVAEVSIKRMYKIMDKKNSDKVENIFEDILENKVKERMLTD